MNSAVLSACTRYRYHLRREWAAPLLAVPAAPPPKLGSLLFVMLNPSTAGFAIDDPTVRKCVGFAQTLGYTSIEVVNLFAYRATDPRDLREAWASGADVVGPDNDRHIQSAARDADSVIVSWGAFSGCNLPARARDVLSLLKDAGKVPLCLGLTKAGQPRHPLMLAYASTLTPWRAP